MSLYKQRGSNVWWYEFQLDGIRYRGTTKTSSKTVAADVLRLRRRQAEEAFNGLKRREKPKTFSAALDEHLAVKERTRSRGYFGILKRCGTHLLRDFGNKLLFEITAADIMEYREKRVTPSFGKRCVNMDLGLMRAVLRRNGFWEKIRPDVELYRIDDEFGYELPESDEPKLLASCARSICRELYTVVILALSTGMRRGEIQHLRWNQVFLDEAYIIVGVSKTRTGRHRRVPLNERAVAALSAWASHFPDRLADHYVFPAEMYSHQRPETPAKVYLCDPTKPVAAGWRGAWMSSCRRAGIKMRFHDLRHTAVTRMLRAHVPLTTVAAIVGWSPATMYIMAKRYAHILQPEMRKAVAVLDGPVPAEPAPAEERRKAPAAPCKRRSNYDRQELYEEVWNRPMQVVAKEYGVSDVALAKTCRKLKVPVPGRGYWAKIAAQKPVPPRSPLPEIHTGESEVGPDQAV